MCDGNIYSTEQQVKLEWVERERDFFRARCHENELKIVELNNLLVRTESRAKRQAENTLSTMVALYQQIGSLRQEKLLSEHNRRVVGDMSFRN